MPPAPDDDRLATLAILEHLETLASRLDSGSSSDHVRRSVGELCGAVREGRPAAGGVQRVMSSITQLQGEEGAGTRRHQQAAQPAIRRLLSALQEELVPALQRAGQL